MNDLFYKFDKYFECYDLWENGRKVLYEEAKKICADEQLSGEAVEIKNKLADFSYDFKDFKEFEGKSAQFGAFVYTIAIEDMEKFYSEKNLPYDVFFETVTDMSVWINRHYDWFGEWGFTQYGWLINHLRGRIFKLGRLQFEPSVIRGNSHEKLGLGLKEGDPILNVHIPRGGRMEESACLDSFEQAKSFFPQYFNYDFKAFGCYTWLFDPDFEKLLPEDSNILKFQKLFKRFPHDDESYGGLEYVFVNITKEDIKDAPTDTSFRKALVEHIMAGGKMRSGSGYRLV